MKVNFSKFEAAGNDFIMIDDRKEQFPEDNEALIQKLCHRQFGVGADGVILIQNSKRGDYKMRIINSDGKEASMCGNGLRCSAGYVAEVLKKKRSEFLIESLKNVHACTFDGEAVLTDLGRPILKEFSKRVEVGESTYRLHLIDTGVPHAVMFVNSLENPKFLSICRSIRNHPLFYPEGVNVNFALIGPAGEIHIRVYERGVEGETFACGSGAAAVCIAAWYIYKLKSPMKVVFYSNQELTCYIQEEGSVITSVAIEGPYRHVFDGKLELDSV